ncbi:hypothetical protein ACIF6L_34875 [Kitasatospora sp. NPDC086009]|uniref:hypothetical protein n=1 Tax=unclassified Kitasatospora TaxID=2633591 RepID=UPI0037CC05EC
MPTTLRSNFGRLPAGWPEGRYEEYNRARRVLAIASHLLDNQLVYDAAQATDDVIRDAGTETSRDNPSDHTCAGVRDALRLLIPTPLPVLSDTDAMAMVHAALDGQEWNGDTFEQIRRALVATGRPTREPR